ncbi:MAG: sugar ABC transporter ATP-binding protein [Ignavibacteriales bacterium]|nr:sugar ABC transporter ATP-binding protein [Ignavibacteriales bacterium]
MTHLLEISSITKSFGPTLALRKASFELKEGEIHALVGENGAGKSTLMKILAGVHRKDEGQIFLSGREVNPLSPQEARSLGISTVFQELSLCNNLSVAENIFANRQPGSFGLINHRSLNSLTNQRLKEFDVAIRPETVVGDLHLAQKQIIEILKAISLKATVLILDEPTSALERPDVTRLFELLNRLKNQGTGIVFISHKLDEVFHIGDRITVFRDGERIATLEASQTSRDEVIKHMVGREIHQIYPAKATGVGTLRMRVTNFCLHDAFSNISFELRAGEILGVAGLTGSGRSEVMQSIFAYRSKDSGMIALEEVPLDLGTPYEAIRHGIVYSPEDRKDQGLFLNQSVAMNVTASCLDDCSTSIFVSKQKEADVATQMVKDLAIRVQSIDQEVSSLSGGNQQKVLLAKCLACKPKVLIVDEPTRGIDIGSKIEIYNLLRDFTSRGGSVVLISSELSEVIGLSDRVIVFKDGMIVGELGSQTTEHALMDLMFQRTPRGTL